MHPKDLLYRLKPFLLMLLIFIAGYILILMVMKVVSKALSKTKLDESLIRFMCKIIKISMVVLLILSALGTVGISTAGILAALSAAAVGVAIALKDSLNNVAGGILLLFSPRFSTGDYISAGGNEGTVINVDLLHTTIRTIDNRQISIPNGVLINSSIINYSCEKKRRVDITFQISYGSDIEKAEDTIKNIMYTHPLAITEPDKPFARVINYGPSSVDIAARCWCMTNDYWELYFDLMEKTKKAFDENGIEIPYDQLDVNIKNVTSNDDR